MWFDRLRQDVHYALRSMARHPLFTLSAMLCLSLGIGHIPRRSPCNPESASGKRLPYPSSGSDRGGRKVQGENSTESPVALRVLDAEFPRPGRTVRLSARKCYRRGPRARTRKDGRGLGRLFSAVRGKGGSRPAFRKRRLPGSRAFRGFKPRALATQFPGRPDRLRWPPGRDQRRTLTVWSTGIMARDFVPHPETDNWVPLQAEPASLNAASTLTVAARLPVGTNSASGEHSHESSSLTGSRQAARVIQTVVTEFKRPTWQDQIGARHTARYCSC